MDIQRNKKEESYAVKNDLARIDFDFDFDIDVSAYNNVKSTDYEKEAKRIIEEQEKHIYQGKQNQPIRKHLSQEEREVITEIFKSQSDKDILSICEDILKKSQNLDGKNVVLNVLNFLDQIGLFGNPNKIFELDMDFNQYLQFAQHKYNLKIDNARANIPQFVKAFYDYLLINH